MEHMKTYSEDFASPLLLVLDFLGRSNVKLFNQNETFFQRNWRFFYLIPMSVFHFTAMNIYMIGVFVDGKNVFAEAFMIPVYVITAQGYIKACIVLLNKPQLEKIIDELGEYWRTQNLNDVQLAAKITMKKEVKFAGIALMRLPHAVTWLYLLLALMETLVNLAMGWSSELLLPLSCTYPFDPRSNWLVYGATYAFQMYCTFFIAYTYMGADSLLITLSAHLSAEFMLLGEDLKHIDPSYTAPHEYRHTIRNFAKSHQKLIILAQELDAALNRLTFSNLTITTINISFFGLAALAARSTVDRLINVVVVMTVLIFMFTLCYFGERLKSASEDIFDAAIKNIWYEGDKNYKKIIYIIMIRSQKPCYITSLKYIPITLQTFTKVLSTTWSYFSLVNTMYEDSQ